MNLIKFDINIKFLIFWLHFLLFFFQQLALPDIITSFTKFLTAGLYVIGILIYTYFLDRRFHLSEVIFILIVSSLVLSKLIFVYSFNIPLVYWALLVLVIVKMEWSIIEFQKLINQVAIVYFFLALLITYTPLNFLSLYEERDLTNRFFPSITRFIGIEGSPAGPDVLYTLVFIINLNAYGYKAIFRLSTIIAIIVLFWTASLSNIVALAFAGLAYVLYAVRATITFGIIMAAGISIYFVHQYGEIIQLAIDQFTSYRATIWIRSSDELVKHNSLAEWLLGRDQMVAFQNLFEDDLEANPHNLSIFALQFFGIPFFIALSLFICYKIRKLVKGLWFFIVMFLLSYSMTNPMPFTLRGNPLIMYTLVICFSVGEKVYRQALRTDKFK